MNVQLLNDSPERRILERLDGAEHLSQRQLARETGISVGLTNLVLKRMARKGWIKVRTLNAKKLAYVVTPHGMQEKGRLLFQQLERTVHFYQDAKDRIAARVAEVKAGGAGRVAIYGTDNVAEILFLVVQQAGLELAAVCDDEKAGERWLSHPVRRFSEVPAGSYDALILAYLKEDQVERFRQAYPAVPFVSLGDLA